MNPTEYLFPSDRIQFGNSNQRFSQEFSAIVSVSSSGIAINTPIFLPTAGSSAIVTSYIYRMCGGRGSSSASHVGGGMCMCN